MDFNLSDAQTIWLKELYRRRQAGESTESMEIRQALRNRVPNDFDPERLHPFAQRNGITLLGIRAIAPESSLLKDAERAIGVLDACLIENPGLREITAAEVGVRLGCEASYASDLFKLLETAGRFWRGSNGTPNLERERIHVDDNSLREIIAFDSMDGLLQDLLPSPTTESDESEHSERNWALSRRVFIVHGHSEAPKEQTARLLERLKLVPIILHERPSLGRTIIEKLHANADVAYAVVLLTPDDLARPATPDNAPERPRARQNVILELGFFLGRLGRTRVCALYDGVELPSDYDGIVFIPLDPAGAWQTRLARELLAAGLEIDLNNLVLTD